MLAAVGANVIWGLLPLYYQPLSHVPAMQTVVFRALLSVPMLLIVARFVAGKADAGRRWPWSISVQCALLIGLNWLLFVYLTTSGRTLEAALAYFLTPLAMVLVGVAFFGERLTRRQALAVAIAATGCVCFAADSLRSSDGLVSLLLAIVMACAVAIYASLRRKHDVPSVPGLLREVLVLLPLSVAGFAWFGMPEAAADGPGAGATTLLLVGAAALTVAPLSLFGFATRRLPMRVLGFIHYLGPCMQLICGLLLGQRLTPTRMVGFGLIWLALVVYTVASSTSTRGETGQQA